jgi:hypothetical protein
VINTNDTKSEKGYWQKPNNYIRIATLVAVAIYTGVQIYQTNLIRSNNIVSQRAFVYPSASQLLSVLSPQDRAVTSAAVIVALTNSGNTPTRDLEFLIRCAISVDSLQEPWGLLYQGSIESLPQFLGPHATTTAVCSFPINQFQKITKGELHGYLVGDISYRDRLAPDIWHKTQFSEELTMGNFDETTKVSSGLFVTRGRHNCTDEECSQ